ncbi:MAG: UvrD-helicase domain-containing protein, partial [Patescibacteria group bacterium]
MARTKTAQRQRSAQLKEEGDRAFADAYQELNPGQRAAVDAIEGPVMVLAGPGTGKTQVLAIRVANILRRTQMDPWNILCLTFTESGVLAMRERLT